MNIKEIIRRKKMGEGSIPLDFRVFLEELFDEVVARQEKVMLAETKEYADKLLKGQQRAVEEKIASELRAKTEETIDKLIREFREKVEEIPKPADGRSPTKGELLDLIEEVMPEVQDGKDADEEAVVESVLGRLPHPKDGQSPTKKELKALISPLIGAMEERVKKSIASALRGLQNANRSVARSGGGIGNPQHETKNVSSATTTVTLTYNVAANGRMIWAYYQGQNLVYGTHYTISGKTMTLLFTPQDSTFIDIVYIRT